MRKQTAVEYLVKRLNQCEPMYSGIQSNVQKIYIDILIEQAKIIEKQQIMQAYNDGKAAVIHIEKNMSLEQYYDETFKNETK